jgi:hypothetical protein
MTSIWQGWAAVYRSPALYGLVTWVGSRLSWLMPSSKGLDISTGAVEAGAQAVAGPVEGAGLMFPFSGQRKARPAHKPLPF